MQTTWNNRPHFIPKNIRPENDSGRLTLAEFSLVADPLPSPPPNRLYRAAMKTIESNPNLFKIVSPINIPRFARYLVDHPNKPFVASVLRGLREGFWPWADPDPSNRPTIIDNSHLRKVTNQKHRAFVNEQVASEVKLGRFSRPLKTGLLPGMQVLPITVGTKPNSEKLRLIYDHSAGDHSPNSLIPKEEVGVVLDRLDNLLSALSRAHGAHGSKKQFVVFKSDVKEAYRQLPVHPLWQIKQVVAVEGKYYVDQCNSFGGRGSGGIWGAFASLVSWIAINKCGIKDLFTYVDDFFSWDLASNKRTYPGYGRLPEKQCRLLELWDELGIPHKREKQLSGTRLTIIGMDVDPNALQISLPIDSRSHLKDAIYEFLKRGETQTLKDYQKLSGWMNWALDAVPRLRPGLSGMHEDMGGLTYTFKVIPVRALVRKQLRWFASYLDSIPPVQYISSKKRPEEEDAFRLTTVVSLADSQIAFYHQNSRGMIDLHRISIKNVATQSAAYLDLLAMLSALQWAVQCCDPKLPKWFSIHTSNQKAAKMFSSLKGSEPYNRILTTVADLQIKHNVTIWTVFEPRSADGKKLVVDLSVEKQVFGKVKGTYHAVPKLTLGKIGYS